MQKKRTFEDNGALTRGRLRKVRVSAWYLFIESRRSKIGWQKKAVIHRQSWESIEARALGRSQATLGEDRTISAWRGNCFRDIPTLRETVRWSSPSPRSGYGSSRGLASLLRIKPIAGLCNISRKILEKGNIFETNDQSCGQESMLSENYYRHSLLSTFLTSLQLLYFTKV